MEQITISPKGQIVIPKAVREALNLAAGTKLTLQVRGQEIVLSKQQVWKDLHGAASPTLMKTFARFRKREHELETGGDVH